MPSKFEQGPNYPPKSPEIKPGQVPLKDDVARREAAAKKLGGMATRNTLNNKPKK